MIGRQVNYLEEIEELANKKKAVYITKWKAVRPAGFVLNFQGSLLCDLLRQGIYVYNKKEDKKNGK